MNPEKVSREKFEALTDEAFGRLPEKFRVLVKNVAILVEDVVSKKTCRELGLASDKDLLGLYTGVPLTERNNNAGFTLPDTVTLYKLPIEEHAQETGKALPDVIYETLWHEIGHHFGLDEEAVGKRENEEFGAGERNQEGSRQN